MQLIKHGEGERDVRRGMLKKVIGSRLRFLGDLWYFIASQSWWGEQLSGK